MKPLGRFPKPRGISALLSLLALLLFVFQRFTLEKFQTIPPGLSYPSLPRFLETVQQKVPLTFSDGLLLGTILLLALAVAVLEIWKKQLSTFLHLIFASERQTLLLLACSSLVLVRFYFARGTFSWGGDSPQHICYAFLTSQSFARGEIPMWTNYLGAGTPHFQFYGFLFFYLVALVHQVLPDFIFSLKFVLGICHIASGLSMYLLVRILTRSRGAGFLAGLAYVLCFWHTQQILVMGRFPLSLFYTLLPLPFYCFERLCFSWRRARFAALGALTLGCQAFTHPGYALWAAIFCGFYMLIRLVSIRPRKRACTISSYALVFLGCGLLFGAFLTLGMWAERGHTGLYSGMEMSDIPGPTLHHVLVWSNYRFWLLPMPSADFHWYGGYLGLSLLAVASVGFLSPFLSRLRWRTNPVAATGVCFALSLFLVFAYHHPLLRSLSVVKVFPPGRYLLFVAFFLALAVGLGSRVLLRRSSEKGGQVAALLLLLIMVDLGPTTFQHPYSRVNPNPFQEFSDASRPYHQQGLLPDYRLFWAQDRLSAYFAYGYLLFSGQTPLAHGFHPGDLRTVGEFIDPFERFLSFRLQNIQTGENLADSPDWELISGGLRLLNVRYLLVTSSDRTEWKTVEFPGHSPILVSSRPAEFPAAALTDFVEQVRLDDILRDFDLPAGEENEEMLRELFPVFWLIRQTAPSPQNTCQTIFLRDFSGDPDLGTDPRVQVLEHRVENQRVDLRVRVSASCYARLSYSYFPFVQLTVDGRPVQPLETAGHFIALPLDQGEHRIVLVPRLSPLRRGLLWLDLLMLVSAVVIWMRGKRPFSLRRTR